MAGPPILVNSRKYDGSIRRSWTCEMLVRSGNALQFVGVFESEVVHPDLGTIVSGTVSHEYYWLDRWYNIFRFHEPDGTLKFHYCNVNMPPTFDGRVLDYIDLDIDVLAFPDGTCKVLDEAEFEENAAKYGYPDDVRGAAQNALGELLELIRKSELPL